MDRREAIKQIAGVTTAAAIAADVAIASRVLQPRYEITPDIEVLLAREAKGLGDFINFKGEVAIPFNGLNGETKYLKPNPEGFAQAALFFAYYERGIGGLNRTSEAIRDKGLEVEFKTLAGGTLFHQGESHNSPKSDEPFRIKISENLNDLPNSDVTSHEIYHTHQYINNDPLLTNTLKYLTLFASTNYIALKQLDIIAKKKFSRRSFLRYLVGLSSASVISLYILNPTELQAYFQTAYPFSSIFSTQYVNKLAQSLYTNK